MPPVCCRERYISSAIGPAGCSKLFIPQMGKLRPQEKQSLAQGLRSQSHKAGTGAQVSLCQATGKVAKCKWEPGHQHPSERRCSVWDKAGSIWGSATGSRSDGMTITVSDTAEPFARTVPFNPCHNQKEVLSLSLFCRWAN